MYKCPSSKGNYFKRIYNYLVSYRSLLLPTEAAGLPDRAAPPLLQTGLVSQCCRVHHPAQEPATSYQRGTRAFPQAPQGEGRSSRGHRLLLAVPTVHEHIHPTPVCLTHFSALACPWRRQNDIHLSCLREGGSQSSRLPVPLL